MDLPLYNIDPVIGRLSLTHDVMVASSLQNSPVDGLGVLANKVVKFLLTTKGSDVVDPDYGCQLMEFTQISRDQMSRLQMELLDSIDQCASYIKRSESTTLKDSDRLSRIELADLKYGGHVAKDTIHIYLKIVSKANEHALLQFPLNRQA